MCANDFLVQVRISQLGSGNRASLKYIGPDPAAIVVREQDILRMPEYRSENGIRVVHSSSETAYLKKKP